MIKDKERRYKLNLYKTNGNVSSIIVVATTSPLIEICRGWLRETLNSKKVDVFDAEIGYLITTFQK